MADRSLRVLRIYHSGVVSGWRARDRELRKLGLNVRLVSAKRWNEGGADVVLDPAGDEFVVAARTVGRHPFAFLYDPRPIWRELRRHRPEVIDCHEEPASLAAFEVLALRWLARSKAPILFYGAENIAKRYPPPFRWTEKWALRTAAGVHCCNGQAAEILRGKGLRGEAEVIGLGVDAGGDESQPRRTETRPFVLGYVGRLDHRKGVHVVIEALQHLPPWVVLKVYGSGGYEPKLRALARSSGVDERVSFCGFASHETLPAIYRSFNALVMPSLATPGWEEQFGRVAVEAMACGVPVIGAATGAIPEVVGDGGVIVSGSHPADWATVIRELDAAPRIGEQLRTCALARANEYSWTALGRRHGALLARCAQQRHAAFRSSAAR